MMKVPATCFLMFLGFISTSQAAVPIQWDIQGYYYPEGQGYVEGGFQYNPDTDTFYNLTLKSYWVDEHDTFVYHDYDMATGAYNSGTNSVEFNDYRFIDGLEPTDVYYYLGFSYFDPGQPGTVYFNEYEILETTHYSTGYWGFTRERQGVFGYAYGAPIPEPETYAMMLAGLGMLGFTAKRGKKHAA